jgi:hypothetical protein
MTKLTNCSIMASAARGSYATAPRRSCGVRGWEGSERSRCQRPRRLPRPQLLLSEFCPAHQGERAPSPPPALQESPGLPASAGARVRGSARDVAVARRHAEGPPDPARLPATRDSGLSPRAAESGGGGGRWVGSGWRRWEEGGSNSRGKWRTVMKAEVIGGWWGNKIFFYGIDRHGGKFDRNNPNAK